MDVFKVTVVIFMIYWFSNANDGSFTPLPSGDVLCISIIVKILRSFLCTSKLVSSCDHLANRT
jgi:hypothetical protein